MASPGVRSTACHPLCSLNTAPINNSLGAAAKYHVNQAARASSTELHPSRLLDVCYPAGRSVQTARCEKAPRSATHPASPASPARHTGYTRRNMHGRGMSEWVGLGAAVIAGHRDPAISVNHPSLSSSQDEHAGSPAAGFGLGRCPSLCRRPLVGPKSRTLGGRRAYRTHAGHAAEG